MTSDRTNDLRPILIAGCAIILVSFAIRASFGVFQIPIALEFSWPRSEFLLAIAIQNLFWGIGMPIFGLVADKFGARKAIFGGAILYAAGLVLSSFAVQPEQHHLLEMLVGFGIAGTGFGVILAVIGRAASDKNRSIALGIGTAAGSAGQIVGPLAAEVMLRTMSWQTVFVIFAAAILAIILVLPFIRDHTSDDPGTQEPMGPALKGALSDPSYSLIFLGFFSCGYQLGFITAHFPAFITEVCGPINPAGMLASLGITTTSALGAVAISVIGLANILGTFAAGWLGQIYSKKWLLAGLYLVRTVVAAAFILTPITPVTVLLFSMVMGALWLATVPLTSGLVAQIYGLKYMGTLYGIVFFSHQLGGFLGVWLGGQMFDTFGDYTLVWWVGVGIGAFSALVHIPIDETPFLNRNSNFATT